VREGIYWDTSALLKLYVAEPDSPYFLELLAGGDDPLLSSSIATTEVLCALHRKEHAGDLKPGAAETVFRRFMSDVDAGRIVTIPYGGDVLSQVNTVARLAFRRPRPLPIRSLDAIHIGSALAAEARTLIATDTRLREVASLVRLKVLP